MSRDSLFSAASIARSVGGRPAPTGIETPGNNTTSRSGSTGSVSRSDMELAHCKVCVRHRTPPAFRIDHPSSRTSKRVSAFLPGRSIRQKLPILPLVNGLAGADCFPVSRDALDGCTVAPPQLNLCAHSFRARMNEADKSLTTRLIKALGNAFTVEGELGRGGMGVVFNARDERLKRQVAIKVLPPELAFREEIRIRFLREAETAARLSHPHIVPIHSVGESPDGLVYFVMAYVDGESLAARLKRRGRLPAEEARRVMIETADALGAAHAVGIIHRDVKPDNILLEGSRGRVVVTDFGIAKALSSTTGSATLTATGVAIGTPHYMSPEQAAGDREIDGRSDIYSLGVVSYQMLTGELPFQAPTVPGILMKHITERAPLVTERCNDCPDDLAACVMRSLEKDPEDRWPTADALRRALEARTATMYRSRRPSAGAAARASRFPPPPSLPAPRSPFDVGGGRGRRPTRPQREAVQLTAGGGGGGEADVVRKMRSSFVSWASVAGGCLLFDAATGWHGWSLFVAVPWGAFGLLPMYMKLWSAGYSWRDVLRRPAAPESAEAQLAAARP